VLKFIVLKQKGQQKKFVPVVFLYIKQWGKNNFLSSLNISRLCHQGNQEQGFG
jgi:hypothetical protein